MLKQSFSRFRKNLLKPQQVFWLSLILACTLLELAGLTSLLRYDRLLVEQGQWYRFISANFVHLNMKHLLLNMAGVLVVMFFFSSHLKLVQWLILIVLTSLFVSIGLYLFNPEIIGYVGLSGVLHGLFIVGAMTEIRRFPVSGWLLLLMLVSKLIWEQFNGAMPGSESVINGSVVVDSHLYGAIGGAIYRLLPVLIKKLK